MTKVLFFGTPDIAVPSLEAIAALPDFEIVGVGVFPDRKVGRKQVLTPCPVKAAAQRLDLPIFEVERKQDLLPVFEATQPDLAIVIAFGLIFPKVVLDYPRLGVVNVHFSLLPSYRGASPVQQAILDGCDISGITWQKMVPALDAGDILWQKEYPIAHQTTAQVWNTFAQHTADEMPAFLEAYAAGRITPTPQDESAVTLCGKFEKSDGFLALNTHTAAQIYNAWRAFTPWPGITIDTPNGPLKLLDVSLTPNQSKTPIHAADNTRIWVARAQLPGKSPAPLSDILRGRPSLLPR